VHVDDAASHQDSEGAPSFHDLHPDLSKVRFGVLRYFLRCFVHGFRQRATKKSTANPTFGVYCGNLLVGGIKVFCFNRKGGFAGVANAAPKPPRELTSGLVLNETIVDR
jgi:hypothetical protein